MDDRKNVLLVGENPYGSSGNSHMMLGILKQIDMDKYNPCCFVKAFNDNSPWELFDRLPIPVIPAEVEKEEPFGAGRLVSFLANAKIDVLIFVGLDIWQYRNAYPHIRNICDRKGIKWIAIFPFDLQEYREDWGEWIQYPDFPCVYSRYGLDMLHPHIPNIRYFRPAYYLSGKMGPISYEDKLKARHEFYPTLKDDDFLFGFIGNNQFRKCPDLHIDAFIHTKKRLDNTALYMHTSLNGETNIMQQLNDRGFKEDWVYICKQDIPFSNNEMVNIINTLDCLIMCSMQEGLSWVPLEAMLCGVPVIASNTTAHPELLKDSGILVPCETPAKLPLPTQRGKAWLDTNRCEMFELSLAMQKMATDNPFREESIRKGFKYANEWLDGVSDINDLIDESLSAIVYRQIVEKKQAVLFAQHSAAGDVLMTTRCFKGIRERFPDMPLHYMTSEKYLGVVENNPLLDEILPWDEKLLKEYEIVLNPHGDKILPGHWGRNSNSILSDFYWKILDIEPDDFHIEMQKPDMVLSYSDFEKVNSVVILHTTGGDPQFRTYKYMADICEYLRKEFLTIQVGGENDYSAGALLDLRGKLSYQETAWIMDKAVLAVTVDSFVSHLAGALGISQVCLFGSGNANVVRPNQMKGELICLSPSYIDRCPGLGPCSASQRQCPHPCTGMHDPKTIIRAIETIKSHGNIRRNHEHSTSTVEFWNE